ncbi:MAG: iron ABC transporter permease, partial [Spirochaetales bacterium]|nr:iron ABC transporter permease [Spirochaetales bacterium]
MSKQAREPVLFLVIWVVILSLVVFVLYPSIRVFLYPSGKDFVSILTDPRYQKSILNSLQIVVLSTLSATVLGFIYAYAITRTDIPLRKFFKGISLLPLFSPPFMVAFSYIMLFGRNGLITSQLLGLQVNIFGWHGLWFAQTVAFL